MKQKTVSELLKPAQRVVERVEGLQEMAKEDEENGKCYHTPHQVEVLAFILWLLPRTLGTALTFLSYAFLYHYAAQADFCGDLDMRDVRDPDALRIYLVTRRDLSSLTHTLRIPAPTDFVYLIPRVLARMDNLCSISLPSFRHYSVLVYTISSSAKHVSLGTLRLTFSRRSMARPTSSPSGSRSYSRRR
ncbi:hypothetical protein ARMGADRAFT_120459 [Armillaria gallica]|uniref:Uncharacterized protein n=1 Tax=Armillaria gallica TaxID=47427 RepID=A0A2H3CE03_ARMGA|nr:hypothetical protein ARMGADRAFT_120459 [Armillaria gallica]